MQKNKFVHEDIKAVCNRAAKKLVALGLAVAVGGTCTIGGSCNRVVSAQTPEELNRRIEAVLERAYERDLKAGLSENAAQANRELNMLYLRNNPLEIDNFEAFIDGEIEARARAEREAIEAMEIEARLREEREARLREARKAMEREARRMREIEARLREIEAREREAIAPQPAQQNDTVNQASSLTLTRLQNSGEFTMGETLQ